MRESHHWVKTFYAFTITGLVLAIIAASAYAYRARDSAIRGWAHAAQLKEERIPLRPLLDGMFGLDGSESPQEVNLAVRDYVYRRNVVGYTGEYDRRDEEMLFLLGDAKQGSLVCSGMARAMAWALNELDVPARIVQMANQAFLDGDEKAATHVTVEVLIDGQWRISDPTFNVSFDCSSGATNLSVTSARECVAAAGELIPVEGETIIAGRRASEYPVAYTEYFDAIGPVIREHDVEPIAWTPVPDWARLAHEKFAEQKAARD